MLLGAMALAAVSCSGYKDAFVANSCLETATVDFGLSETDGQPLDETEVPPQDAVVIHAVIADTGEPDLMRVSFVRGEPQSLRVDSTRERPVPIVIPVDMCPGRP